MTTSETDQRLLLEIKGDLGETYGVVREVRHQLAEHRHEDRDRLDRIDTRLGTRPRRSVPRVPASAAR